MGIARPLRLPPIPVATVIPFPRARNVRVINRIACNMAEMPADDAERYLRAQLRVQATVMSRRGIAEDRIRGEVRALEYAIRATLWRFIMRPEPGDAA